MKSRLLRGALLLLPGLSIGACIAEAPPTQPPPAPAPAKLASHEARSCVAAPPLEAATAFEEDYGGRRETPAQGGDFCQTADTNLARAEERILRAAGGPKAPHEAWDHKAPVSRLTTVERHLPFGPTERTMLAKNGFVVLEGATFTSYAEAFHDVYQSELPIWVSADSILNAVFASNDHLIADVERVELTPLVSSTLEAMHCALAGAPYPMETRRDLDLYLTVARSLLADAKVPSLYATDDEASAIEAAIRKAEGISEIEVFGRGRVVDWSMYLPRGHYADPDAKPSLAPFFRAAMFLSRFELNVVSRSSRSSMLGSPDPRETPREAVAALALADLAARANVLGDVARLDRTWTLFAGRREDLSIANLLDLQKRAAIGAIDAASFEPLKAAIGNDFQRTARLHPMPEGATVLPVIATLLGPRVVADAAAFRPLLHTEVPERRLVLAGDVAYVLGLDRGKAWLKDDILAYPSLPGALDRARAALSAAPDAGDLYGAWLSAVRSVAKKPDGVLPSFMQTATYDDLRMNTIVAGYGQIRHNYVLMAGQAYDEGGCQIPDGWVEPLPAVYGAIVAYAERGAAAMKELDPKDDLKASAYFDRLGKIARVLGAIAGHEVAGESLSVDEKRFLSMVVEMSPGSTGGAPTYTGWYFDLFRHRASEGLASASFVADYQTSAWTEKVQYAGATGPRLGVFVVDAGGAPRVMVGPVARAYSLTGSTDRRYTDESVGDVPDKVDPWAATYTAPFVPPPELAAEAQFPEKEGEPTRIILRSPKAIARVVVEILDHHRNAIATFTPALPADKRVVITTRTVGEGLRVRVGEHRAEGFSSSMSTSAVPYTGLYLDAKDREPIAK